MAKSRFLVACLGCWLLAPASRAAEGDQATIEAAALFQVIMSTEQSPQRCQYRVDWSISPVPDYVARKYLDYTLHADLTPSEPSFPSFIETLDPQKRFASAFCDANERAAYENMQFESFVKDKSARAVCVESTIFSFPVFDLHYQNAIVIIDRSVLERERVTILGRGMRPGDVLPFPAEGAEFALVYRKSNGVWKLRASDLIGQS